MKILGILVDAFIGFFGITQPGPGERRAVTLLLGGFLLLVILVFAGLGLWMFAAR